MDKRAQAERFLVDKGYRVSNVAYPDVLEIPFGDEFGPITEWTEFLYVSTQFGRDLGSMFFSPEADTVFGQQTYDWGYDPQFRADLLELGRLIA